MKRTPDQLWFEEQIKSYGAVLDTTSPYKFHFVIDAAKSVELVKWYAREFDPIINGGGWWKHKTRNLIAQLTGLSSRPGKLYMTAKTP